MKEKDDSPQRSMRDPSGHFQLPVVDLTRAKLAPPIEASHEAPDCALALPHIKEAELSLSALCSINDFWQQVRRHAISVAQILVELGCSQYEIMAIPGHSEAKTSEVYTRRVERWKLALGAMERVDVSQACG